MSRWGRAQDQLHEMWTEDGEYESKPGIVQRVGITREQWEALEDEIIERMALVFAGICGNCMIDERNKENR